MKVLLTGLAIGLGGAAYAGLRLLDSRHALLAVPGAALLLGMALLVNRLAPCRQKIAQEPIPPPPPYRGSMPSLHAERVHVRDVARERRVCDRCRFTIRHEHEGDLCWIAVRRQGPRTALVHFHIECADEIGEPLP